jgi:hypothetical protein
VQKNHPESAFLSIPITARWRIHDALVTAAGLSRQHSAIQASGESDRLSMSRQKIGSSATVVTLVIQCDVFC